MDHSTQGLNLKKFFRSLIKNIRHVFFYFKMILNSEVEKKHFLTRILNEC